MTPDDKLGFAPCVVEINNQLFDGAVTRPNFERPAPQSTGAEPGQRVTEYATR